MQILNYARKFYKTLASRSKKLGNFKLNTASHYGPFDVVTNSSHLHGDAKEIILLP